MNYFLKQPSSSTMVGSLLKTKRGEVIPYYCMHCLRSPTVCQNHVRDVSSYVSALKLKVEKNKISKKKGSNSLNLKQEIDVQNITKILKLTPPRESGKRKKKMSDSKGIIGALGWKNKYSVDSTRSYDPSLLSYSLEVEKFYKDFGKKKNLSPSIKLNYSNLIKKLQGVPEVFESLDKANDNSKATNLLFNKNSFGKVNKNVNQIDKVKSLVLNQIERQPQVIPEIQEIPEKVVTPEERKNKVDFQQFSVFLTQEHSLQQFLHSSIDVCISNDMVLEAYHLFNVCRKKPMWKDLVNTDKRTLVNVYNTLLYGLSVKGYWSLSRNVTQWMEMDGIKLNSESYATLLYCLGRTRNSENRQFIYQEVVNIMNNLFMRSIPPNDLFLKSSLSKEELELVLAMLREVIPEFEIEPVTIDLSSDCNLIKDLHMGHSNLSPPLENFEAEHMNGFVEEQLQIEKKFFVKVKAVSSGVRGGVSEKHVSSLQQNSLFQYPHWLFVGRPLVTKGERELFDALKNRWHTSLTEAVINLQRAASQSFPDWFNLSIYLNCLPVEKFVDILLETTLNLVEYSGGFSPTSEQLSRMLGSNVAQCYQIRKKEISGLSDRTEALFKNYVSWYLNPQGPAMNTRQKWQLLIQDSDRTNHLDSYMVKWPDEVLKKLGKCLLGIILNEVKFTTDTKHGKKNFPVLYTLLRYRDGRFSEEVKCHPSMTAMLERLGFDDMCFRADEMPMLCPPKPWKSVDHGGYLILSTKFIRPLGGVEGKSLNLRKVPAKKLFATFDSLNALQAVPWMVNEGVLDVALEVFKNGGSAELDVPSYPDPVSMGSKSSEKLSFLEMREEKRKIQELRQQSNNQYGLWCEALYRLSLADHFRKRIFWMPQNCDFRGRVYPVPPLLNHLGSDLYRSLLIFAKGKPLGPKGLDWMKIHLINLTGSHKKRSVEDRLEYANEILPEIIDSAEKPLTGNKWWVQSDEPWQTLATCMEIKKVLSSPNPEEYVCRLPIHQDGSCNGLQHYAALGKDLVGAKSVNLNSCDVPQDVYTAVAELIEEERMKDAEQGVEIAKILKGFIQRKVVKQTIMTTVYGVTLYGARLQIGKRLEEIPEFPQEYVKQASTYLSCKTFLCLKKMFTSARQIQEWFINCATEICQKKDYVQWVSPMGLPVLQSYAKYRMDSKTKTSITVPDTLKQKNAFPPNFIHSLDSCHMMLTALYCEQAGLTFAAVHDCFWTHPNTVDIMNKICREQFISLHSQPILEDLSEFFKNTYIKDNNNNSNDSQDKSGEVFEAVPKKGDFDLKDVMNSVYFFS